MEEFLEGRGIPGGRGQRDNCNSIINKIYLKNCKGGTKRLNCGQLPQNNKKSTLELARPSVESSSSTCWQCDLSQVTQALSECFLIVFNGDHHSYFTGLVLGLWFTFTNIDLIFFWLLPVGLNPICKLETDPTHIPRRPRQAPGRQSPVRAASCSPGAPSLVVPLTNSKMHSPQPRCHGRPADPVSWRHWDGFEDSRESQCWVSSLEQAFNRQMWAGNAY